ncbi:MAG: hypothetical protein OEY89_18535, partial [Gammaproteobacteria bacterium]|nr:hypothetical protein [Gammaproteobacteria bacterium]
LNDNGYNPISAHYKHNYTHSLSKTSDWAALKSPEQAESGSLEIKNWLSLNTIGVLSSYALGMIGKAIAYILKAAGIGVQLLGIAGITILDKLSYALDRAIQTSKEISDFVSMLLEKILSIVGAGINVAKNITVEFIRWVFAQLSLAVYRLVNLALKAAV